MGGFCTSQLGAIVLSTVSQRQLVRTLARLARHSLSQDPHDSVAQHLLEAARHFSVGDKTFATIYLLSHGVIKIGFVWALLRIKLWAYPTAIVIFGAFAAYQIYQYALSQSLAMLALTVLDIFVILLTWAEYRRLKAERATKRAPS